jgi:hypothetical protein
LYDTTRSRQLNSTLGHPARNKKSEYRRTMESTKSRTSVRADSPHPFLSDFDHRPASEHAEVTTPVRPDSLHLLARQLPTPHLDTLYYFSPALFDLSTPFCTKPVKDPFEVNDGLTAVRHERLTSLEISLASLRAQIALPSSVTSPCSENAETIFNSPPYSMNEPSTWPTLHLPYHTWDGYSTPTQISEMACHVHYKGAGAIMLHNLLTKEMEAAQTREEKGAIELSAYLSWPFNCTRDGWRVYSGMSDEEVGIWKEAMEEWIGKDKREGKEIEGDLEVDEVLTSEEQEGRHADAREYGKRRMSI